MQKCRLHLVIFFLPHCAGTAGCITWRTTPQWKSLQKKRSFFRPTRRITQEPNRNTSLIALPDQKLSLGSLLRLLHDPCLVNCVCMLYTSGAVYYRAIIIIDMLCVVSAGCVIQIWVWPRASLIPLHVRYLQCKMCEFRTASDERAGPGNEASLELLGPIPYLPCS